MPARSFTLGVWVSIALAGLSNAHIAPFHPSMWCFNGTDPSANPSNNNAPVQPLYELPYNEFWMHHSNGCDEFPPEEGKFLELDAGGSFTVELATNRAATTYTLDRQAKLTEWPDAQEHPENYTGDPCITSPNIHTHDEKSAAGTAWAISYTSDIKDVHLTNLAVFSVRYHTPYKKNTTYDVPEDMPPCPDGGCICVWGWIPNSCGILNMYMFPYRCKVNPGSSPKTIGEAQPPAWCEDDETKCVKGAKQIIVWHQNEMNNVPVSGNDLSGALKVPVYNMKCGFPDGAQTDIFVNDTNTQLFVSNSTASNSSAPSTVSATPFSSGSSSASATPTPSGPPASSTPATPTPSGPPPSSTPTPSPSNAGNTPSQPPPSATPSALPSGSVTSSADPDDLPATDGCTSSPSPTPSPSSAGTRRAHSQRKLREKRGFH